jgi:hypothetical protein
VDEARDGLTALVRIQHDDVDICARAELHLLERALRERLAVVGVEPTPDVAVAMMAVAHLVGAHAAEWGGDARSGLAEVALLGLRLLDPGCDGGGPA